MKSTVDSIRYSKLQVSLLSLLLKSQKAMSLDDLVRNVYRTAGKMKPDNARPAIAALVRGTSLKLTDIGAKIERTTGLGRGVEAEYRVAGDKAAVHKSVRRHQQ